MNATVKICSECGGPIPDQAPQGICPKCLLASAATPTETGSASSQGDPPAPPTLEEVAAAFPQLEILELIGQGGMGFVYRARQRRLDRLVALKILSRQLANNPAFAERFAREGRLLARLNHSNIVAVYDFGESGGFFYLLMEYVDGANLRQAMQAGRFTPAQALGLVPKICEALQFAHERGVLHRDIKPENILLDLEGHIKIADFGIAKMLGDPQPDPGLTADLARLGTPHYMAPEQVEKPAEVDHRADIYSLGVVFYEMLTGELPLGRFAPPSSRSDVNARIDEIVLRALAKDRELRQQSAAQVKTEVETSDKPPAAPGESSTPPDDDPSPPIRHGDDWRITCLTCGRSRSLASVGGFRLAAASAYKSRPAYCAQCRGLRLAGIHRGDHPLSPEARKRHRKVARTIWGSFAAIMLMMVAASLAVPLRLNRAEPMPMTPQPPLEARAPFLAARTPAGDQVQIPALAGAVLTLAHVSAHPGGDAWLPNGTPTNALFRPLRIESKVAPAPGESAYEFWFVGLGLPDDVTPTQWSLEPAASSIVTWGPSIGSMPSPKPYPVSTKRFPVAVTIPSDVRSVTIRAMIPSVTWDRLLEFATDQESVISTARWHGRRVSLRCHVPELPRDSDAVIVTVTHDLPPGTPVRLAALTPGSEEVVGAVLDEKPGALTARWEVSTNRPFRALRFQARALIPVAFPDVRLRPVDQVP